MKSVVYGAGSLGLFRNLHPGGLHCHNNFSGIGIGYVAAKDTNHPGSAEKPSHDKNVSTPLNCVCQMSPDFHVDKNLLTKIWATSLTQFHIYMLNTFAILIDFGFSKTVTAKQIERRLSFVLAGISLLFIIWGPGVSKDSDLLVSVTSIQVHHSCMGHTELHLYRPKCAHLSLVSTCQIQRKIQTTFSPIFSVCFSFPAYVF